MVATVSADNGSVSGSAGIKLSSDSSGVLALQSGANTTAVTIDTSQNVGIGTTSPFVKLQVTGTIKVATGNAQGIISLGDGAGATVNCGVYRGSAGAPTTDGNFLNIGGYDGLVFTTGNAAIASQTERMRIDSSGNVGIGTSPNAKLEVNGQIRSSGTTAQAIYIYGAASTTPYITINQYGVRSWDIGAGYYSSGTFSIQSGQVNGVYLGATATSWASASDERLKDIIEPIDNALIKVNGLRSVIGKYKTDEEGVRRSFLIAQDIQTQFPEALESSDPDKLGVQYTDVIPLLVASIKELKAINDTQAETINALTARIVALESK